MTDYEKQRNARSVRELSENSSSQARQFETPRQLDRLDANLNRIVEVFNRLESRLDSVAPVTKSDSESAAIGEPMKTSLGGALSEANRRLAILSARLDELADAVEL